MSKVSMSTSNVESVKQGKGPYKSSRKKKQQKKTISNFYLHLDLIGLFKYTYFY